VGGDYGRIGRVFGGVRVLRVVGEEDGAMIYSAFYPVNRVNVLLQFLFLEFAALLAVL
jgi:hypothetical protein